MRGSNLTHAIDKSMTEADMLWHHSTRREWVKMSSLSTLEPDPPARFMLYYVLHPNMALSIRLKKGHFQVRPFFCWRIQSSFTSLEGF
jgi:hypothetical protein